MSPDREIRRCGDIRWQASTARFEGKIKGQDYIEISDRKIRSQDSMGTASRKSCKNTAVDIPGSGMAA